MNNYISEIKNKKCLVTGGAGFIGSNLSRFLANNGAKVIVLDNFSTGRKENTLDFEELGIKLFDVDISEQEPTSSYFSGMDYVFHQAAVPSVPRSIAEPLFTWHLNHDNQSLDLEKEALALEYIVKKHIKYLQQNITPNVLSNHYRRIARLYEKLYPVNGHTKQIAKFYKKAFKIKPTSIKNIFYRLNMMIGYQYTRCIIAWMRKIRGIPNA